jgi:hypothetical protein
MGFLSMFGGSSGTVGPTPQEQQLASIASNQWKDYTERWLPMQDHFASVVSDMGKPDSWQRQEAEGKGNADVAQAFAQSVAARTSSELARGINVGSTKFKLGAANSASAEAESKGLAIVSGNESIDKAYLANLGAIARAGQGLAGSATQGLGVGAETASRIAISSAQERNAETASNLGAIGFGIGALGSPQGIAALKSAGQGIGDFFSQAGMPFSPYGPAGSFPTSTPQVTETAGGTTTSF